MGFDFRAAGDGYVITVVGEFPATELGEVWERIQAERPPAGFEFGVFDLGERDFPALDGWELNPETVAMLHPVARMINATLQFGFRLAVVSTNRVLDPVIADVLSLAELGASGSPEAAADLRRFDTLDDAIAWGRAGTADQCGTTVRE